MATVLLVEDDRAARELAEYNLVGAGHEVAAVESAELASRELAQRGRAFDLVITDVRLTGRDGLTLLDELQQSAPEVPVIVVTAHGNVQLAVDAMRRGASDFIGKPFNRDQLLLAVTRTLRARQLEREVLELRDRVAAVEPELVAASEPMKQLLELVDRVAGSEASVLISGETGTGKELVARRIHRHSSRAGAAFVAVNCAAIPAELLESELFGHERGAFTGATRARKGRFRQADGGTLFLDEVGELPLDLQGKLLRALQERVVDVVGSDEPVPVDVRVLAATNQDLEAEALAGRFRQDLFYRLNVVDVHVPPLRERVEDIPVLAQAFVRQFAAGRVLNLSAEVVAELKRRSWPGNVRQLQNACERLVLLSRSDTSSVEDLPRERRDTESEAAPLSLETWPPLPEAGLSLVDLEKRVIERVLELKQGNVTQAAQYLGVPRHVLQYRLSKYGISRHG